MLSVISLVVLFALVFGIPLGIMLYTNQQPKRGCGCGCATCKNREFCHRGEKKG